MNNTNHALAIATYSGRRGSIAGIGLDIDLITFDQKFGDYDGFYVTLSANSEGKPFSDALIGGRLVYEGPACYWEMGEADDGITYNKKLIIDGRYEIPFGADSLGVELAYSDSDTRGKWTWTITHRKGTKYSEPKTYPSTSTLKADYVSTVGVGGLFVDAGVLPAKAREISFTNLAVSASQGVPLDTKWECQTLDEYRQLQFKNPEGTQDLTASWIYDA